MEHHLTPASVAITKIYNQTLEKEWRKGDPPALRGERKLVQSLWRTVRRLLKTKNRVTVLAAIPLLGMYLEKTIIQKDTGTPMFTATLVTTAKTRKQPQCSPRDGWIQKMWHMLQAGISLGLKKE